MGGLGGRPPPLEFRWDVPSPGKLRGRPPPLGGTLWECYPFEPISSQLSAFFQPRMTSIGNNKKSRGGGGDFYSPCADPRKSPPGNFHKPPLFTKTASIEKIQKLN